MNKQEFFKVMAMRTGIAFLKIVLVLIVIMVFLMAGKVAFYAGKYTIKAIMQADKRYQDGQAAMIAQHKQEINQAQNKE